MIPLYGTIRTLQTRYEDDFMKKNSTSPINSNNPLPLYFQIKEDLRTKIETGKLKEGEYLPSEFKLMEQYGVSRPTIRQAIDLLCQEEYLEKQRGIGTLIKKNRPIPRDLNDLLNFNEEAQKKSFVFSTEVLDFQVVAANQTLRQIFGAEETSFYKIKRLRYLEHKPAELVTTYIPKSLMENLEDFDLSKYSLFDILAREEGVQIGHAEKVLKAVNASAEDARLLKIPVNTAVQFVRTITYNTDGIPIEFSHAMDTNMFSHFKIIATRNPETKPVI